MLKLNILLDAIKIAKSSYLYQKKSLAKPDKYADLHIRIKRIFYENGYRRIHATLKLEEIDVSEKVICRIMEEEHLIAKRPHKRRYSSYKGEISDAPENIVKRDFHAQAPNRL